MGGGLAPLAPDKLRPWWSVSHFRIAYVQFPNRNTEVQFKQNKAIVQS